MSSYKFIEPVSLMTDQAVSGTDTINSTSLDIRTCKAAAFIVKWTGDPTGSLAVYGSMEKSVWVDMGISTTQPSGTATNALIDIQYTAIPYVRVGYTNASGTGAFNVIGSAKGF